MNPAKKNNFIKGTTPIHLSVNNTSAIGLASKGLEILKRNEDFCPKTKDFRECETKKRPGTGWSGGNS